ncbi:MAG: nucleotide exchange factor GrpE [Firmicutes bacterium]|nr:nucleotide exchange factor GrpE [Bacillota bacterium]
MKEEQTTSPEAQDADLSVEEQEVPEAATVEQVADAHFADLQAQVEELRGKWLRTQADFDNFRKRTRQEREDLALFANAKLITDLLPVLDHFAMAVAASESGGSTDSLAKGVDMVYKQLLGVMENAGLRAMDPIGQPFDPNRHEAVMQEPVEGVQPGHVASVLRTGYLLGERVLRPAMVKISQ